jgi:hypothetical protein
MHQKLLILYLINNKANFFFFFLLYFCGFLKKKIKISGYFLEDRRHNYDYCIGFAFYL